MNELFTPSDFGKKSEKANVNARMNFDLSEESFDFKPITEGLGFHKKPEDKKVYKAKLPPRKSASVDFVHPYTLKQEGLSRDLKPSLSEINYNAKETEVASTQSVLAVPTFKDKAFGFETVTAYLIDLLLVCGAFIVMNLVFKELMGINLSEYGQKIRELDLFAPWFALFGLCYVSYFTLVDFSGGFGKSLFNLHIRSLDNNKASLSQCFFRSLVSFLSLPLFFMVMLFDFQGKLSETKIVIPHES
jgi:hypothetical protein